MRPKGLVYRSVPMVLLAGALLLLALVFASLHFAAEAARDSKEALNAARLNNRSMLLFSLLQDAESSQRGYIITGADRYLNPFKRADVLIHIQFPALKKDLIATGMSDVTVGRLDTLVGEKIDELRATVDLRKLGRLDEAVDLIQTDSGKQLMDEIRQINARIEAFTGNIGFERGEALDNAVWRLLASIIGGAIVLVLLMTGVVVVLFSHSRQMEAAQRALALQNETLEEKVRGRTEFLERANRELQSYSYIVGHDLRAPLVNIMGFTSELERASSVFSDYIAVAPQDRTAHMETSAREAVHEDVPEALGFIRSSMKRMDDLINEILKLARAGNRQLFPETLEIDDLVGEALSNLKHRLEESGATVSVAPDLPVIFSDRLALLQIFGNLLDNAVKYSEPGRAPEIRLSATKARGRVEVSVRDNGRGIAARDMERIFELFRRSGAQDRPGEGIGLAHVRALARRLGGDVTVNSVPGEGTTFIVAIASDLRTVREREAK